MWAGITIIVSFMWGSIFFEEPTKSLGLSILAILILLLGFAGIGLSGSGHFPRLIHRLGLFWRRLRSRNGNNEGDVQFESETERFIPERDFSESANDKSSRQILVGLLYTVLVGVINGTMMVPSTLTPHEAFDSYVITFSMGVMLFSSLLLAAYFTLQYFKTGSIPP